MLVPAAVGRRARQLTCLLSGPARQLTCLLSGGGGGGGAWCVPRGARRLGGAAPAPPTQRPRAVSVCDALARTAAVQTRSYSEQPAGRSPHRSVIGGVDEVSLRLHRGHLVVQHARWPVDDVFLSLVWLRDHCRCGSCYNHGTHQRQTDVRQLAFDVHPLQFNVNAPGTSVEIIWHDGHQSEYSLKWLWENSYIGSQHRQQRQERLWQRCLWDGRTQEDLVSVDHESLMSSQSGVRRLMKGFLTHGAVTVTGVRPSVEATREVIERVGVIQHTLFGGLWEFSADGEHADTAYSRDELLPHTDGTYYSEPPGVQIFHCLHHDGAGGETTLVDGFAALQRLSAADPAAYRLLSTEPCVGEYRDPARHLHLVGDGPVIAHRSGAEPTPCHLLCLRFNPYDRAAGQRAEPAQLEPFYRAYGRLAELLWAERQRRRLKLTPGTVLLLDNWRVLHGRTAFSGRRHMCGAYMPRSDVMSRARGVGLLV